jgi:hypothetical protein
MGEPLAKLRFGSIFFVDMERIKVHGQTRPVDHVGFSHSDACRCVHIPHSEVITIFAVFHLLTSLISEHHSPLEALCVEHNLRKGKSF